MSKEEYSREGYDEIDRQGHEHARAVVDGYLKVNPPSGFGLEKPGESHEEYATRIRAEYDEGRKQNLEAYAKMQECAEILWKLEGVAQEEAEAVEREHQRLQDGIGKAMENLQKFEKEKMGVGNPESKGKE
ncbi:hypothetical protein D4R52_00240 [bacterium]|nr:MAG: hypothetical protein D4R52_00240 [bacterium]